jgi:hypothetical protein
MLRRVVLQLLYHAYAHSSRNLSLKTLPTREPIILEPRYRLGLCSFAQIASFSTAEG